VSPEESHRQRGNIWGTGLILIGLWWVIRTTKLTALRPEEIFWVFLLYLLCTLPTLIYVAQSAGRLPIMPMWGLGYFMMFGMPLVSEEERWSILFYSPETVLGAFELVVGGAAACMLAYYTPIGGWVDQLLPHVRAPWDPKRAPGFGVGVSILGLAFYLADLLYTFPASIAQIISIAASLSMLGLVILLLLQLRGQLPKFHLFLLWGIFFPIQLLARLGTGALWDVVVLVSPMLFCYTAERRKIPWAAMLAAALLIIPFLGTKHEYRSYAWDGNEGEIALSDSPIQRGFAFIDLTTRRLMEGGVETYTVAAETSESRISHLGILTHLMETTPAIIPYWNGETYLSLLWTFVPRFLYPDKPTKLLGQEFGHRYELLHEEDTGTSFNLPHQVLEMYINFGIPGVLIGMTLIGCFYRALTTMIGQAELGERGLVVGCTMLANLLLMDGSFSLVFGGIIYFLVIIAGVMRFMPTPGQSVQLKGIRPA